MSNRMEGFVSLVTGGSAGIGQACALALAQEGSKVLIIGRKEGPLKEVSQSHENITYLVADVSMVEDMEKVSKHLEENFGGLDILINNAAVFRVANVDKITHEHYVEQFKINVEGVVLCTQKVLPLILKRKGTIVNISSVAADAPLKGSSIYAASKGAVNTLTRAWARELGEHGVRVNVVSPGPVETGIFGKGGMPIEELEYMTKDVSNNLPLKRLGTPEEVAKVVVFLASSDASYITGAQLNVDGGYGI